MSAAYVGEIRMFAGNFAPVGWFFCQGQLLPISEYEELFNLIGTTYGGDGQTTFALPDLQSRFPIHAGTSSTGDTYQLGQTGGVEEVTLTTSQLPQHSHALQASNAPVTSSTANSVFASWQDSPYSTDASSLVALQPDALVPSGGNQPHENRPPYLALNFIISTVGFFPSQT